LKLRFDNSNRGQEQRECHSNHCFERVAHSSPVLA
jgi:hypothetical protein